MTSHNNKQGDAFEKWVGANLFQYARDLKMTPDTARYDIEFMYPKTISLYHKVILECKCFKLFHKGHGGKLSTITFQRGQFEVLQKELGGANIFYVCGVLMNSGDVYPVVIPNMTMREWARNCKAKNYITASMPRILSQQPLKNWIASEFKVEESSIHLSQFEIREGA